MSAPCPAPYAAPTTPRPRHLECRQARLGRRRPRAEARCPPPRAGAAAHLWEPDRDVETDRHRVVELDEQAGERRRERRRSERAGVENNRKPTSATSIDPCYTRHPRILAALSNSA